MIFEIIKKQIEKDISAASWTWVHKNLPLFPFLSCPLSKILSFFSFSGKSSLTSERGSVALGQTLNE